MLSETPQQLNSAALILTWLSGLPVHPRTLRLMISRPWGWLSHPRKQRRQSASGSTGSQRADKDTAVLLICHYPLGNRSDLMEIMLMLVGSLPR